MKTIQLEKAKEKHISQGKEIEIEMDDADLLRQVVNTPVEGINFSEMRQRLNLLDKVEKATDTLELEDAEFDFMKGLIEKFKFGIVSKHVAKLCEKFTG